MGKFEDRASIHEAGHVFMAQRFGRAIWGYCQDGHKWSVIFSLEGLGKDEIALIYAAGYAAERVLSFYLPNPIQAKDDLAAVWDLGLDLYQVLAEAEEIIKKNQTRVCELVEKIKKKYQ